MNPPDCEVSIRVCHTPSDIQTVSVLNYFMTQLQSLDKSLSIDPVSMPLRLLGRRSIGRNIAAKETDADIIWFADVDFIFRGCLQDLSSFDWPSGIDIVFPESMSQSSKSYGNNLTDDLGIIDIDPDQFVPRKNARAIGGIQIVKGGFAREHGYLDNHPEWRRPIDKPFPPCKEDARFRRHCRILKIDLPNVYRIQHSEKGRNLLKYEN